MKILTRLDLEDLIFIDIETIRGYKDLKSAPEPVQEAWRYKLRYSPEKLEGMEEEESYLNKAALYPEFGRIVCISLGKIVDGSLTISSSYETQILRTGGVVTEESEVIQNAYRWISHHSGGKSSMMLCGHAIKGFDIPFIARRSMINGLRVLDNFDTSMLKPWEVNALDTNELWKGTGFYGASLPALTAAFGIPSPKVDIEGSEVSSVYYGEEDGMSRIKEYCERDVKAVVNIVRKIRLEEPYE